jgi:hypothetical protein
MDDNFDGFLEDMGPAFDKRYVPPSSIERYQGKLPSQLLKYWKEYGWCGYADGLFWTVDPTEYEPVLEAWIGGTPFMERDAYHIIARSAFGHLFFWGEKTGHSLTISPIGCFAVPHSLRDSSMDKQAQRFFGNRDREETDFGDYFSPALKALGRLKSDEMYGFVPAIAAGGSDDFKHLQKLKIVEHLVFLAQLDELRLMNTGRS